MSEEIIKYLKNSIDEKGNYCYSLPVETTKAIIKEINRLNNIITELEKYIHNELVLDFYNDDIPCELIINKMEKMIKELKDNK